MGHATSSEEWGLGEGEEVALLRPSLQGLRICWQRQCAGHWFRVFCVCPPSNLQPKVKKMSAQTVWLVFMHEKITTEELQITYMNMKGGQDLLPSENLKEKNGRKVFPV